MRILFVCDFRSPTARNWISQFSDHGYDIHVLSTFPVMDLQNEDYTLHELPVAFGHLASQTGRFSEGAAVRSTGLIGYIARATKGLLGTNIITGLRDWIAPIEIHRHVNAGKDIISNVSPDLVHALRIPFEGMFASLITPSSVPLIVSVWGNDFTLHAPKNVLIARATRRTLSRTRALLADTHRDINLAREWGWNENAPALVAPGAGGIRRDVFYPGKPDSDVLDRWRLGGSANVIINPRGIRGYVRTLELIESVPRVLRYFPDAVLVLPGTRGNRAIEEKVNQLGVAESVRLGPSVSQGELAELYRASIVAVSPSIHDGTPNSLLETMASGCFPVSGDIESIREWIDDGVNGLLCDPMSPESIGEVLVRALKDKQLREAAVPANIAMIGTSADRTTVAALTQTLYECAILAGR